MSAERIGALPEKPLAGRRVLVTRAREQADELVGEIERLGGVPEAVPVIGFRECADPNNGHALREALSRLESYDWAVFTSVNGVRFFFRKLDELGGTAGRLSGLHIAAVGEKTAAALEQRGVRVDLVPEHYQAEHLLEALLAVIKPGQSVLLPKSALARDVLPAGLRRSGIALTAIDVYEPVPLWENGPQLRRLLEDGRVDVVTFTSPSTVRFLLRILEQQGVDNPAALVGKMRVACIGRVTAAAAAQAGIAVDCTADPATAAALAAALAKLPPNR